MWQNVSECYVVSVAEEGSEVKIPRVFSENVVLGGIMTITLGNFG